MSDRRSLQYMNEPGATPDKDVAKAKALLSRAVKFLGKAGDAETKVAGLESSLAAVRKKKAGYYWEAGRLLTEARRLAPHGTWTGLLVDAELPTVHDNNWRMLFEEFPDPRAIEDIKITEALARAKEMRSARRKGIGGPPAPEAVADARHVEEHRSDMPEPGAHGRTSGFRIWSEHGGEGPTIVHAVRKGQRGWTPQCRVQWDLGLKSGAPPLGDETHVNCPGCIGKLAAARAEAKLHEATRRPHGSDLGYVWEILDGDDPADINARWLPITAMKGKAIITPEKIIEPIRDEPVFRDRKEALENARARYQQMIEADEAEIERLKAEEDRLRQEKRLAERKIKKIESLLAQEA